MLHILLRRSFKGSKFKALVNLTISRLALLKNQRQARCSFAITDVVHVLRESQQDRALIRVEHVIRERNTLDAFAIIHVYCILLSEKIQLIEQEKSCPEDLKEAISSLIFASSRCASADFPELQRIRSVFASRYGREFILRATELRNCCGVNPQLIQKLSVRQPSLESRIMVLKEIADKNGISLQLEEAPSSPVKGKSNKGEDKQLAQNPSALSGADFGEKKDFLEEITKVQSLCNSLNRGKRYKNVAEAAQEAFLLATYAAAAARAAVELSTSSPGGSTDDFNHPNYDQGNKASNMSSEVKSRPEMSAKAKQSCIIEDVILKKDKDHNHSDHDFDDNQDFNSDDNEETSTNYEIMNIKKVDPRSILSGMVAGLLWENEDNQKHNESDDEANSEIFNSITDKEEWGKEDTDLPYYSHNQTDSGYVASSRKFDNEEQMSSRFDVKS